MKLASVSKALHVGYTTIRLFAFPFIAYTLSSYIFLSHFALYTHALKTS